MRSSKLPSLTRTVTIMLLVIYKKNPSPQKKSSKHFPSHVTGQLCMFYVQSKNDTGHQQKQAFFLKETFPANVTFQPLGHSICFSVVVATTLRNVYKTVFISTQISQRKYRGTFYQCKAAFSRENCLAPECLCKEQCHHLTYTTHRRTWLGSLWGWVGIPMQKGRWQL